MRLFFWLCLLVAALTAAPGDANAMSTSSTRLAAESLQDTPAAEPPCNSPSGFDCPTTTDDGYVYAYDTATKSFVRVPIATAGSPDPQATYRYTLTPACPRAQPFDDVNCVGAAEFCAQSGATGIHE